MQVRWKPVKTPQMADSNAFLMESGVKAIFGPGTPVKEIAKYIRSQVKRGVDEP